MASLLVDIFRLSVISRAPCSLQNAGNKQIAYDVHEIYLSDEMIAGSLFALIVFRGSSRLPTQLFLASDIQAIAVLTWSLCRVPKFTLNNGICVKTPRIMCQKVGVLVKINRRRCWVLQVSYCFHIFHVDTSGNLLGSEYRKNFGSLSDRCAKLWQLCHRKTSGVSLGYVYTFYDDVLLWLSEKGLPGVNCRRCLFQMFDMWTERAITHRVKLERQIPLSTDAGCQVRIWWLATFRW